MNLKELIQSDEEAKKLAELGAVDECAKRLKEIAPKVYGQRFVTELSIYKIYSHNLALGEKILQTIEAVAQANPVVKRILKWLGPGSGGVDVGEESVRLVLSAPVEAGGIGLPLEDLKPLFDAALVEPSISGLDVTNALIGD